jgi:thiamine-monophosphate kinase
MFEKREKGHHQATAHLTPLSSLGEFGLIDRLTSKISHHRPDTIKGVGDDAAVIRRGESLLLFATDLLAEGIHFDLTYAPLKHLGYKSVVVNVSDMAAMNGIPGQITVSLAVSSRFTAEALDELYSGIIMACNHYQVDLVGGDTSSSQTGLFISVSIIGEAKPDEIVYRSGASPGDLICVTGDLGSAYMGLLALEREKKVFQANPDMQPELSGYEYQIGRQLKPEARTDMLHLFRNAGIKPTSMIDISDGLSSELLHLCKNSGTGCKVFEERIPIDPETKKMAMDYKIIPSVAALSGGEDYELLFTVGQRDYEKIRNMPSVSVIGHIVHQAEGKLMITPDKKAIPLTAQGWDGMISA